MRVTQSAVASQMRGLAEILRVWFSAVHRCFSKARRRRLSVQLNVRDDRCGEGGSLCAKRRAVFYTIAMASV